MSLETVLEALTALPHPSSLKCMLTAGLSPAMADPDERHKFQKEFLTIIERVLNLGKVGAVIAQEEAQTVSGSAASEVTTAQEALAEAEQLQESAASDVEAKAASLSELRTQTEEEKKIYDQAVKADAEVFKTLMKLEAEKEAILKLQSGPFAMLAEGTWEDESQLKKAFKEVEAFFAEEEATLLAAMPKALKKKPADRGPFDQFTVETLGKMMSAKLAALEPKISSVMVTKAPIHAECLGARAIYEVAKKEQAGADKLLKQAKTTLRISANATDSAKEMLEAKENELAEKNSALTLAEANVEKLDVALAALKDLVSPQPQPEPVEEVATAAATEEVSAAAVTEEVATAAATEAVSMEVTA